MKIKNFLIRLKWSPASFLNRLIFGVRGITPGKGTRIYGALFIRGGGSIHIGKRVVINSCRETNPIGGDVKTILYAKGAGKIRIGDGCGISNSALIALESITLEEDVMIGGSCRIYDHDFHSIYYENRMQFPDLDVKSAPVTLKKGVFIGAQSIILKGVTVGERSVVGAGSVVTKDIPPGELWAGNPAKFIRTIYGEKRPES